MSDLDQKTQDRQSDKGEVVTKTVRFYDAWEDRFKDKTKYSHEID